MKRTKIFRTIPTLMLSSLPLFSAQAKAEETFRGGIFVEPSISYQAGTTDANYPQPFSNSTGRLDGFGLGARVGFHMNEMFFAGGDLRYTIPYFRDSAVSYEAKAISTTWGPVVGVQMPNIGLRAWIGYILGGDLNPEQSGSFDVRYLNPSGFRVGAGFRVGPVSLNLEKERIRYGQAILEQVGPFATNSTFNSVNLINDSWIASVSMPLEL